MLASPPTYPTYAENNNIVGYGQPTVLGHDFTRVSVPQPPVVNTVAIQPPRTKISHTLSHYDEDHGDHVIHRAKERVVHYTPPPYEQQVVYQQPDIVAHVPVTRYMSVPTHHLVDTSHIDLEKQARVENVVQQVPTETVYKDTHYRTVQYQEPVTTMVTKTRQEPYPVEHRIVGTKSVTTPVITERTVPIVHNQQKIVTDNHIVAVPLDQRRY